MDDVCWIIDLNRPAVLITRHAHYSIVNVYMGDGIYEMEAIDNDNINFGDHDED